MDKIKQAEDALFWISPDLPYDEWMRVGMAAQSAGLAFETFDRWCSHGAKYDKAAVRDLWKSYRADKGIGPGTLFHIAKDHGYKAQNTKPMFTPALRASPASVSTPAQGPAAPGMAPQAIWDRCEPATHEHPYIQRKHGVPDGLRIVPKGDPLQIMGKPMERALVVPVMRPDGSISSLQCVTTGKVEEHLKFKNKPTKLNLPNCSLEGWFMVGEPTSDGRIFVCEGIGQAWASWQASGHAAVVAFGYSRMAAVAGALKEVYPGARLILVPDVGKEPQATKLAMELQCELACMPNGWPENSDVNDLAIKEGPDALEALLDRAKAPKPAIDQHAHPLARFVELDCEPKAPKWLIPGFIGHGVVIIAGAHGVGKTTAMLPLSMVVAGLHRQGDPLAPKHWRHVIYIVEDVEQAERILAGMVHHSDLGLDQDVVKERLHLVPACRLEAEKVAAVGTTYTKQFTREVDGVELLPLVVLDTKAAVIAMENENDNAEGSEAMAALKQGFEGLPTWVIGHVSKATIGRADAASLSMRGGSSFEADANQVLYLIKEDDSTRYLVRGKTRFEAKWADLKIESHTAQANAPDEFGVMEVVTMRWGTAAPAEAPREVLKAQASEDARQAEMEKLRALITSCVGNAWQVGTPINKQGVKAAIPRSSNTVIAAIDQLITERWLYEVEVPSSQRTNPKRRYFLIALSPDERKALQEDGVLPDEKMVIPASWRKHEVAMDKKGVDDHVALEVGVN
jgi:hypothetical protein